MRASDNGTRPPARYGQNDRAIAIGRKNYLFAGSDAGGRRAAAMYSLIETAKLNGINPQAYLADVLARIADHPAKRVADLLPWNWQPAASIRAAASLTLFRPLQLGFIRPTSEGPRREFQDYLGLEGWLWSIGPDL